MPASVCRRPRALSAAVQDTLLVSRMPSVVKYHSSTYSIVLILSMAYLAGDRGTMSDMVTLGSKSAMILFRCAGSCRGSVSGETDLGGGIGGGGRGGGDWGVLALWLRSAVHMFCSLTTASSSEHPCCSRKAALIGANSSEFHCISSTISLMETASAGQVVWRRSRENTGI